jgi:hypothetical protein
LVHLVAVLEDILLDAMTMHVEKEVELLVKRLIHELLAKLLCVEDSWVQDLRWVNPFAIQVTSG